MVASQGKLFTVVNRAAPPPLQATIVSMYQVCSEVLKVHSQYQAVTNLSEIDYPRLLPSSHDRTP